MSKELMQNRLLLWCLTCNLIILSTSFHSVSAQVTYHSKASGNWNNKNTWLENNVPTASDHAIINASHTVTLNSSTSVTNLTIVSGGVITDNGSGTNTISGNFIIDGTYAGTAPISLTGSNASISGSGTITNPSPISVTENKNIPVGTNLTLNSSDIVINGAYTITNYGTITVGGNIIGSTISSTWTNEANSVLNVGGSPQSPSNCPLLYTGTLNASSVGNTINYFSVVAVTIKLPSVSSGYNTYHHLVISGINTKTIPDGSVAINGDLTINSTLNGNGNNKKLFLRGNWISNGNFTEGTSAGATVAFDGSSDQSIYRASTENIYKLVVDKPSGTLHLNVNVIVESGLTMNSGNINTGNYKLALGLNTTNVGSMTWSSGTIAGKFERWINAPFTTIDFPIGTGSFHRPVSIFFNSLTPGSLIAEFKSIVPGNNGLPLIENSVTFNNTFRDGYWSLTTPNTLDTLNFNLDLTGNGFSGFAINDNTRILTRYVTANPWTFNGSYTPRNGNTIKRLGIATLGEFCFASDASCFAPVTSSISGLTTNVCSSTSGLTYSVTNTPGSVYNWTITGGIQTGGGNTNSITVDWGSTGVIGNVLVVEDNGCTLGSDVSLSVNVNPLPPGTISGKVNVPQNELPNPPYEAADETYSVVQQTGYTYNWTVTGGTISSGQGTRSIKVTWGPEGVGQVCVQGVHACGTSVSQCLVVNIYKVIVSKKSGNWNTASNWSCSCVPGSSDNITILSTHTIAVDANAGNGRTAKNVTINQGGILNTNSNPLTILGDITINGSLNGTGTISLKGAGSIIDGTGGAINNSALIIVEGNKTIWSSAILTKASGSIIISEGSSIINYGSLTIGGDLIGGDNTSTFENGTNSSLTIGGNLLATGELIASATGNTVVYSGSSAQAVKTPLFDQYDNLTLSGTGGKSISTMIYISGNFTDLTDNAGVSTFNSNSNVIDFNGTSNIINTHPTQFYSITIGNSKSLIASSGQINILKNFINDGSYSHNNGTILFNGTTASIIAGTNSTTLNNLICSNPSSVSVQSTINLEGVLTINSGTFDADGPFNDKVFTIKSYNDRPTQEGSVGVISSGAVLSGKITVERYISDQGLINRYISSPLNNIAVSQLQDDFSITGPFTGTSYPCLGCKSNASSFKYYDEVVVGTLEKGYKGYPAASGNNNEQLQVGRGYVAYMYEPKNFTLDITGNVNQGNITLPITYTVTSAGISHDGWNLVGNPYPSSIKWGGSSDWTRTSIDPIISVPDLSTTTGYPNYFKNYNWFDDSGDPSVGIIATGQAFWVKANAVGASLTVKETAKISSGSGNFYRTASPSEQLVIAINDGRFEDRAYLKINTLSTNGFDRMYDGYKFKNDNINIYLLDKENRSLVMHTLPALNDNDRIPVVVEVSKVGNYAINFYNVEGFSQSESLFIIDTYQNLAIQVSKISNYTFTVEDNTKPIESRFYLSRSSEVESSASVVSFFPNPVKDYITIITIDPRSRYQYEIYNSAGKLMVTDIIKDESKIDMRNFPSGMYILRSQTEQGVVIKKIIKE